MRILIILFLIILAAFPVLLLGYYIYKKDSVKEPKSLLLKLFAAGLVSSIIVIIIDIIIDVSFPNFYIFNSAYSLDKITSFIVIFIEIALLEEFAKWFCIKQIGYKSKEFDQIFDIIVYSVFVGLGFAFFENLFYVLEGGIKVGILRGFIAVPAHAVFGVFMGYYLGKAKISKDKNIKTKYLLLSIFVPVILHTLYDYIVIFESSGAIIILLIFMVTIYTIAFNIIKKVSNENQNIN